MAVHVSTTDGINNHTEATSWVLDGEHLVVMQGDTQAAVYRRGYWDYAVTKTTTEK